MVRRGTPRPEAGARHLWYLLMLFVFTLVAYRLFILLRGPARRVLDAFTRFLALPGVMYLLAIPTVLTVLFVSPLSPLGRRDWGGWSIAAHLWFFIAGFVIISSDKLQARIKQWRWPSTALGVLVLAGLLAVYKTQGEPRWGTTGGQLFWGTMALLSWTWMLALLGHGMHASAPQGGCRQRCPNRNAQTCYWGLTDAA